nr:TonB-dependent receptor plug domain-containing protein [Desulfatitalea alkaliphila]
MTVTEKVGAPGLQLAPGQTVIEVEKFDAITESGSVVDLLQTQSIIDFRGDTGLDPGVDTVYMRGFDSGRFVTAIDGMTVQKTGGRKSSNVVDWATLPSHTVESIELLPGPHSALYDSKSIGGVVNIKSAPPRLRDTLKPSARLNTSYGSYNTQNHSLAVNGAVQALSYDFGYRHYRTDGYLRNTETKIDNYSGGLGLVLPLNGYLKLSAAYSDVKRQAAIKNIPGADDYDPDYPTTESGAFSDWQKPTWDGESHEYRLGYAQNLPIGRLQLGAYHSKSTRGRHYYNDEAQTSRNTGVTSWWSQGVKIMDAIRWTDRHETTIGMDLTQMFDGSDKDERIRKTGGFVQHQWRLLPMVDVKLGLRHETLRIWVTGSGAITGREATTMRRWDELIPKSFITWRMGHLAPWLRDTSLSAGVSKIWRAPDAHGDYNPQGRPAGVWLEPEHGMGYDLMLNRRLWRDIGLRLNYGFYEIKDYIASNSSYAKYSGADAGALRYSDYKINVEKMQRHGVDVDLGGHLTDTFSFYLGYAWQKLYNKGEEPAGYDATDRRAEHILKAGLRYDLFARTTLKLDYNYRSAEVRTRSDLIAEAGEIWNGEVLDEDLYDFYEQKNPGYNVFDFAIEQVLFKQAGPLRNARLKFYIQNLLDEKYFTSSLHPATDRTFGVSLNLQM